MIQFGGPGLSKSGKEVDRQETYMSLLDADAGLGSKDYGNGFLG